MTAASHHEACGICHLPICKHTESSLTDAVAAPTPVQVCPDCGRPLGTNPPSRTGCCYLHIFGGDDGKPGYQMHLLSCQTVTITRLRQELASLQASHDALVAERELERAVAERAVRLIQARRAGVFDSHEPVQLTIAVNELLASRAKGGG